jgi:hypothetical protein
MKLNTDRIVSLSAMVVGIGSLFVILYQTHLTRQMQHASVLPYLMISLYSNTQGIHIVLRNTGIGPALVEGARVRYKGREIESDPYDFYIGLRPAPAGLGVNKITSGRLIPAGESIDMLGVDSDGFSMPNGNEVDERRRVFLHDLLQTFEIAEVPRSWYAGEGATNPEKAVIEIDYASVYGDRWRLRSDRFVPEPR